MSNIDPQNVQQIVQLLATYGTPAGIAAAQTVGAGAVQALGSGTTKAIKSLWGKIRHKSKQEGGMAEIAITEFETAPNDIEHQHTLAFIIKQLCKADTTLAQEIMELFNEVKEDPKAEQFIQHISGNAQVGIAGINNAPITIHQTTHQGNFVHPTHQLQIELSYAYMQYGQPPHVHIDDIPTLCVSALNVGTMPSYVNRIEFESDVDGHIRANGLLDFGKSQMLHKFGQAIQPGQKHQYFYYFPDLSDLSTLGRKVIPVAILVYDEIGNMYRKHFAEEMSKAITKYYRF